MKFRTANLHRMRCSVVLTLAFCSLALALPGSATAALGIWFTADGKPTQVTRGAGTIESAVRHLLAGPTATERRRGLGSAIPRGTPLLGLDVSRRIVTVDLGVRFAAGRDRASLEDRVGQLIRTVHGVPGVKAVRVLIKGGVPVGIFPGYNLSRPVRTAIDRVTPAPTTRDIQQQLVDLGFMAPSGRTGVVDTQTSTAVLGFQKWAGLGRDGTLGAETITALMRTTRPEPARRAPGRRIEVQLRRQLALLIEDNKVVRTVHISSGMGGLTPTGSFRVYRKEQYSWSVPFKVWLPWASYFTGGIAFHEFGSVPTYAASHGCIRVSRYDAVMLFGFAKMGTPVDVLDEAAV